MGEAIIVALITGGFALLGTYLSNRKSAALVSYRLEQLEEKVNKHNNLIERTYKLEEQVHIQQEKINSFSRRMDKLEHNK